MNRIRDWKGFCQKCFKKSKKHSMSLYDVSLICPKCLNWEIKQLRQQKEVKNNEI